MEVKGLTTFALNLPFVKNHSTVWENDDLLKVAYYLAVHMKKNGVSSKETVVSNVVEAVFLVVDEVVKSDPEKSKNLKDYVVNSLPSLLLANSLFDNGASHFLKKLFCYCVSVSEEVKEVAEEIVEKVSEEVKEVVEKVAEEVKEVVEKVVEEVKEVAEKVAEEVSEKKKNSV